MLNFMLANPRVPLCERSRYEVLLISSETPWMLLKKWRRRDSVAGSAFRIARIFFSSQNMFIGVLELITCLDSIELFTENVIFPKQFRSAVTEEVESKP